MTPLISIIIPVYNVAPYLRECLDSVLDQTFTDWEAICVDDGSTDGSGAILDEYAAKDKRFRIIHQANAGVSAARNRALDALDTKGGYIWFVDGDDAIHPEALRFLRTQFDMFGNVGILFFRGYVEGTSIPAKWPDLECSRMELIEGITGKSYNYAHGGAWTSVFKEESIAGLRFEPFSMSEDTLFAETAFWKVGAAICGDAPLYFYRRRDGQATGRADLKKTKEWLLVEHRLADHLESNRDRWQEDDMRVFFVSRRNQIWLTHLGMMFRLPVAEISKCVRLWTSLQQRRQKIFRETPYRRFVVRVVDLIPSGALLKMLVLGPDAVKRRLLAAMRSLRCTRKGRLPKTND